MKTEQAVAEQDGYRLSLQYPAVARAGLDVRWQVTVEHSGGFDKELTLAVTGDYFDIYETQGFWPEPSATKRDGDTMYLTFDAPDGDTFVFDYDAYIQPSSQVGRDATVALLVDGQERVTVDSDTRLVP